MSLGCKPSGTILGLPSGLALLLWAWTVGVTLLLWA